MIDPYAAPVIERRWCDADFLIECGMLVVKTLDGVPVVRIPESVLEEKLAEIKSMRDGILK